MILRHFDVKTPKTQLPRDNSWEQLWSGYYWMSKCMSDKFRTDWEERNRAEQAAGMMHESDFQRDCFLSILVDVKREHVNMFELGAGWGRVCLNLAGVIDYRVIPLIPKSYRCLAVEGEPTHYEWAQEHFETQGINATLIHAAVSDKNGTCRFLAHDSPDSQYGQAINPLTSPRKIPSIQNIRNIISGKTIKLPMYSVDHLAQAYDFDHIDILQMDIQGAEDKAVIGASRSIENNLIDYILINVHTRELSDVLRRLLSPHFDLIVNILRDSVGKVEGFPSIMCHDGIQLYKRKNI